MNSNICPICIEDINNNTYIMPDCNHKFHDKCILQWYTQTGNSLSCPLCRTHINPNDSINTKQGRIDHYKKMSRRKYCPKIIKDNCSKIKQCNKDIRKASKEYNKFRNNNNNIFKKVRYLRRTRNKLENKKYDLEKSLDSIPILYLFNDLTK